jgi:hypothetical protein
MRKYYVQIHASTSYNPLDDVAQNAVENENEVEPVEPV